MKKWILIILMVMMMIKVGATPVGYDFINEEDESVGKINATYLEIWNTKDSYYFNISSGIQFSNFPIDFWTKNIFCGGYKHPIDGWIYDCNDELPFNWDIKTDNLTYINITGWKDKTIMDRTVRYGIRYSLNNNDNNLSVQFGIKNIGGLDIPYDLGFAWRVADIKIDNDEDNDFIKIWNNSDVYFYDLSNEWHINFTNLDETKYELIDNSFIRLTWNENLNYKLMIDSVPQQNNTPVTLGINLGTLAIGQEKYTTMFWKDPISNASFTGGVIDPISSDLSWTHNIPCGDDMVMIVGVTVDSEGGLVANSVTYNDDDLYRLGNIQSSDTQIAIDMWNISNPDCGSDYTVAVDYRLETGEEGAGISVVYYGVDRVDNESIKLAQSPEISTPVLAVPTTSADQIVVDVMGLDNIAPATINGGDNQVFIGSLDQTAVSVYSSYAWDDDGSVNLGWSFAGDEYVQIGVPLIPADPAFSSLAINETIVFEGSVINHSVTIGNNISSYVFSWNGSNDCDGVWINTTNTTTTSSRRIEAHNVSAIGDCGGETVGYRFWSNNSINISNNEIAWAGSDIETYEVFKFGGLNVTLFYPVNNTNITQINTTDINATIVCLGGAGSRCGLVKAHARHNDTGNVWKLINTTQEASPIFVVGGTGATLCYQESANKSTECGGVASTSGNYSCEGVWGAEFPCENTYDEDFTNFGVANVFDIAYMYVNYTKPINALNSSLWQVKDDNAEINLTINSSCWNQTPLQLRVWSNLVPRVMWECLNDSNKWSLLRITPSAISKIYEEAMWWNISGAEADNPQTSPSTLEENEEFNVSWTINVTGADHYLLDVKFNSSTYSEDLVVGNATGYHRICVGNCPSEAPPPPVDTCDCPTSGNWVVDCSDFCLITDECNMQGNDFHITGTGQFLTKARIYNYGSDFYNRGSGCEIRCEGACFR